MMEQLFGKDDGHLLRAEEVELGAKLGEGAFGAVFKGRVRGVPVAVKVPTQLDEDQLEEFRDEVATMTTLSHPRLAMLLGCALPAPGDKNGRLLIVMELLDGDMDRILEKDRKLKRLSLFARMEWALQAAQGLAWLHGANRIHRDLK